MYLTYLLLTVCLAGKNHIRPEVYLFFFVLLHLLLTCNLHLKVSISTVFTYFMLHSPFLVHIHVLLLLKL